MAPPPPYPPPLPPLSSAFWTTQNVQNHLHQVHQTINLAKALQDELEMIAKMRERNESTEGMVENGGSDVSIDEFSRFLEDNRIDLEYQERLALEAANELISKLKVQVEPFRVVTDEATPWEEKSAAVRLANRVQKYKRNKLWRKKKRKRIAEKLAKEREDFSRIDREADEWRAREIAKDIAKLRVEKMKDIAKVKEKEEKRKLESELELVLIVEKLQELRSIRVQKLKKQGHFLPDEDDKFMERVKAAVEEEERQAIAGADTVAAQDAIANIKDSRKNTQSEDRILEDSLSGHDENIPEKDRIVKRLSKTDEISGIESATQKIKTATYEGTYDRAANLPMEFYHYYYGSNTDLGTLIEVRRTWDAYIRPGGSRIPGHWVQPPPPANEIWASYLVNSSKKTAL
ncbi:hypothetical protein LIER_38278 [Lithospermum erythrorhizon]|uniref:Uncharacterized protein n=1 Tax=Lithospermum erythrorhizon TaxID=34254 RepID=A0AAV3PZV8_LITER